MGTPTPENLLNRGKGRPPGSPNKTTQSIKEMIEAALDEVGGKEYLKIQAIENPGPFLTLVGKILPKVIDARVDGDLNTRFPDGFNMKMLYPPKDDSVS